MSRQLLNWNRSRALRIAKMLAWTIVQHERANEARLWSRVGLLFPAVYARVTGGPPIAWETVVRYTLLKQGAPVTANKLAQRADKAERYCEWTPEKDAVVAAYREVVGPAPQITNVLAL